jgi:hypothetical protein
VKYPQRCESAAGLDHDEIARFLADEAAGINAYANECLALGDAAWAIADLDAARLVE